MQCVSNMLVGEERSTGYSIVSGGSQQSYEGRSEPHRDTDTCLYRCHKRRVAAHGRWRTQQDVVSGSCYDHMIGRIKAVSIRPKAVRQ